MAAPTHALALLLAACAAASQPSPPSREPGLSGASSGVGGVAGAKGRRQGERVGMGRLGGVRARLREEECEDEGRRTSVVGSVE